MYFTVKDPFDGQVPVVSVVRSDGKVLNAMNYWHKDGNLHLMDDPGAQYTVNYGVTPEQVSVEGQARLQARADHTGIQVTFTDTSTSEVVAVTTDQAGIFSVDLPAGTYQVSASRPGYLTAARVSVASSGPVVLPPVTLLAGDADRDGAMDWRDLRLVVGSIVVVADPGLDYEGQPLPDPGDDPEVNPDADLNADGVWTWPTLPLAAVNLSLHLSPWPGQ